VKRVVVTGLGMINSLGLDKESAFSAILEGQCGIKKTESGNRRAYALSLRSYNIEELKSGKDENA